MTETEDFVERFGEDIFEGIQNVVEGRDVCFGKYNRWYWRGVVVAVSVV